MDTEEETQLRNHLKWARIRGEESEVPKEITLEQGGVLFTIQIWEETPVTSAMGEDKGEQVEIPATSIGVSQGYMSLTLNGQN